MEQRIERLEAAIERHEEQIIKLFDKISGLKKNLSRYSEYSKSD